MAQAAADGGDRHAFVYQMAGMGMTQVMDVYERYAGLLCVFFQDSPEAFVFLLPLLFPDRCLLSGRYENCRNY